MELFIIFFFIIMILYFISLGLTKKEEKSYFANRVIMGTELDIERLKPETEVIVTFKFLKVANQFLLNSYPNIIIDDVGYKMVNNHLDIRLGPSFSMYFYAPYLGFKSYKIKQQINLELGAQYIISIKPNIFVFLKPKIIIEKV